MPQISKLIKSRDSWKSKAVIRAEKLRESRKTRKRHKNAIADLKSNNKKLQEELEDKKKIYFHQSTSVVSLNEAYQTRMICILLVLQAVVSYRATPRILKIINIYTQIIGVRVEFKMILGSHKF